MCGLCGWSPGQARGCGQAQMGREGAGSVGEFHLGHFRFILTVCRALCGYTHTHAHNDTPHTCAHTVTHCTHARTHAQTRHTCVHIVTHIAHVRTCTHMHTHMRTHAHAHPHIRTWHTYTHAHTHTHPTPHTTHTTYHTYTRARMHTHTDTLTIVLPIVLCCTTPGMQEGLRSE